MKSGTETTSVSAERIAEECVAVRLRLLTRAVTRIYNLALRPHGLTISQMNIVVAVSCFKEAKQQQVCQALHLEKSTLSRDAERMREKGWLESLPGDDGRISLLRLTNAGRRLLQQATPAWQQAQQQATALLGERDIAAVHRAARTVRASRVKGLI